MTAEMTPLEIRLEASAAGIKNESDIARAILGVIEDEETKPADGISVALLKEALDAALAFAGESPERVANLAASRRSAFLAETRGNRKRGRGVRLKILIPIAAALAILSSFAVVSIATGRSIADMTNYLWQTIVPGERIDGGDVVIEKAVGARGYDEFSGLLSAEGIEDVKIPVGVEIADPLVVEYGEYREITASLTANGASAELEIDAPSPYEIAVPTRRISGFDVLVSSYDGVWQGEWIADGNWYMVKTDSENALHAFIAAFAE